MTKTTVEPICCQIASSSRFEPLARHLVERAERLVHEQQRRLEGERARDRDPLLHAAGELPRVVVGEAAELDELEHLLGRAAGAARSQPSISSGSAMFFATVRQSKRTASWKTIP